MEGLSLAQLYSGSRLGAPHERAAGAESLFQMRWGVGRHAAGTASMKLGDRELFNALARLDRQASLSNRNLKTAFLRAARVVRDAIAERAAAETTLAKAGARRRIRIRKARNPRNPFVAVSVAQQASIIHAGRLRIKQRAGRVASVPGTPLAGNAFLMNRKKWRGKRRRVYVRDGGEIKPVAHPLTMQQLFEGLGTQIAHSMTREALRQVRRIQGRQISRAAFGSTTGSITRSRSAAIAAVQ